MASFVPVAVYGQKVPAGGVFVPAFSGDEATGILRITMAAIDPSAPAKAVDGFPNAPERATLKIIRESISEDDDESDADEEEDDEDGDGDVPMTNGFAKALKGTTNGLLDDDEADEIEEKHITKKGEKKNNQSKKTAGAAKADGINGSAKAVIKADLADDDADETDELHLGLDEFVLCTLDTSKNYQQPLDVTVDIEEGVFFKVSGTHDVYLTGNYLVPTDEDEDGYGSEDELDQYDLSPDEDELADDDDEDDELEDTRLTELDSEEEVPELVPRKSNKGKNKRVAEDSDNTTNSPDEHAKKTAKPAASSAKTELQPSKKQAKKLKNNDGKPITPAADASSKEVDQAKPKGAGSDQAGKKVQFARNLEQGPSSSPKSDAAPAQKKADKQGAILGVKVVQGVTVDDKKLGQGRSAKKGDRVSMRYIGKLEKGHKVFDANKKGKPFSFKLGVGEVIKGWDIGVAGMSPGGERRITIPASLGYGGKDSGEIPANSNLIFDIKLLSID